MIADESTDPLALVPEPGAVVERLPDEPPRLAPDRPPRDAIASEPEVLTSRGPRPASHVPPAFESSLEREVESSRRGVLRPPPQPFADAPPTRSSPAPRVAATLPLRPPSVLAAEAAARPAPETTDLALDAVDRALADRLGVPPQPYDEPVSEAIVPDDGAPSRAEVFAGLGAVTPAARECVPRSLGTVVEVRVTFVSRGRVTVALLDGSRRSPLTPEERSCVARAVRAARIEPFALERFDVVFPLRL